ncbi:uncharacterized protein LOC131229882 [Magnolia sinica]|uniref:uncharacterized protein LOC131229882 n=1 Tax=Magnolia sinica TaxID=86752 RepID=UPI00265A3DD9|nr:uncharacterized protein LOC131229882 [Magnolia sinica]
MVFEHNKRPFSDDESCQLSHKHPRRLDYGGHLPSFAEFVLDVPGKQYTLGEGEESLDKCQGEERVASPTTTELAVPGDKEFESSAFGNLSGLSWVTSDITIVEEARTEPALEISRFPHFPDHGRPPRVLIQSEETYSSLLDHPSRRPVSVGPDHQADVPAWSLPDAKDRSGYLNLPAPALGADSDADVAFPPSKMPLPIPCPQLMEDDDENLMGICIMPMPHADNGGNVGNGRTDCSCLDKGSVRCVRQHVMEAREKLRAMLGQERFVELGFYDMGEYVGQKWSEEEDRVFQEVVFSNPLSSGKNFWNRLSLVFPTRAKKDLVSYYFNVFMLRRRAEQNRLDPLNIDSDDDEWHGSNEGEEFAITEEDGEDSIVESPLNQDLCNGDAREYDYCEDDEGGDDDYDSDEDGEVAGEDDDGVVDDVSEAHAGDKSSSDKWLYGNNSIPIIELASDNLRNGLEDQDVQDDSSTSSECQLTGANSGPADWAVMQENQVNTDYSKRWHSDLMNESLTDVVEGEYVLEPCDSLVWDTGFITSPEKGVDSLAAWDMIEEVFRDGTWNDNRMWDGPGFR